MDVIQAWKPASLRVSPAGAVLMSCETAGVTVTPLLKATPSALLRRRGSCPGTGVRGMGAQGTGAWTRMGLGMGVGTGL